MTNEQKDHEPMSPGIVAETGQTVRQLISSMATAPMVLAVLIFNLVYIVLTGWIFIQRSHFVDSSEARWEKLVELALRACPTSSGKDER